MVHLFYSMLLFLHSLYYIIKALIRGDFIFRNSPIIWLYTGFKGGLVCIKGICKGAGTVFVFAGSGLTSDHYYGSPVCKTWFDTQIRKRFLDTMGIDYHFPTDSKIIYTNLVEVPNHIKNQVLVDSFKLKANINIGLDENNEWISRHPD